jgi:hypothetical protein
MKRALFLVAIVLALSLAGVAMAGPSGHVQAPLASVGGSGVTGFVQLQQLPHGGTNVHVIARGLTPEATYTSFYYDGANCEIGPEAVGTFTANAGGVGTTHAKIDDDLDEVASVSVRTPDYAVLFACANVG